MKYVQPYGITDPDAPYINGNPSTGTMGSIPPAASIEHPQREIVNLINSAAAVTPAEDDLFQLAKTVQSAKVVFGVDIGTQNAVIVNLPLIPDNYSDGMKLRFRSVFAPSGPVTLDAGRGARPLLKSNGGPVAGGEWSPGDIVEVIWDAPRNRWQLPVSPYTLLYANKDYYVDALAGNDSNDGLSWATAFATLQKAQNTTKIYNVNGYTITIHVNPGQYGPVGCGPMNGTGAIRYLGNPNNPSATIISTAGFPSGPCFTVSGQGYSIDGFRLTSPVGPVGPATPSAIYVVSNGGCAVYSVEFGTCLSHHLCAESGGVIAVVGPIVVNGSAGGSHMCSTNSSFIRQGNDPTPISLKIAAPMTVGHWAWAISNAVIYVNYTMIENPGNCTAGLKYLCQGNGVMGVTGHDQNYYPPPSAGVVQTGGQYMMG
jgi:hypothetical protein